MTAESISATNMSAPSAATAPAAKSPAGTSERNIFMTLLVAQLKNQDPLAPQDGAAFVAQLAQFNSLDQLVGIKQSLDDLNTKLTPPKKSTEVVK